MTGGLQTPVRIGFLILIVLFCMLSYDSVFPGEEKTPALRKSVSEQTDVPPFSDAAVHEGRLLRTACLRSAPVVVKRCRWHAANAAAVSSLQKKPEQSVL